MALDLMKKKDVPLEEQTHELHLAGYRSNSR